MVKSWISSAPRAHQNAKHQNGCAHLPEAPEAAEQDQFVVMATWHFFVRPTSLKSAQMNSKLRSSRQFVRCHCCCPLK